MRFGSFKFGSIQVEGATYEYNVVIDRARMLHLLIAAESRR